jgi:hypothetical protein
MDLSELGIDVKLKERKKERKVYNHLSPKNRLGVSEPVLGCYNKICI